MPIHFHARTDKFPMVCNAASCTNPPASATGLAVETAAFLEATVQARADRKSAADTVHAVVHTISDGGTETVIVLVTDPAGYIVLEELATALNAANVDGKHLTMTVSRCTPDTVPDADGFPRMWSGDTTAPVFYVPAVAA
jgi:hypothetical protein